MAQSHVPFRQSPQAKAKTFARRGLTPGFGLRQPFRLRGAPKRRFGATAAGAFGPGHEPRQRQRAGALHDAAASSHAPFRFMVRMHGREAERTFHEPALRARTALSARSKRRRLADK